MRTDVPGAPARVPRRARHLIPAGTPRRRELLAGLVLLTVLAGVLFAQATLGLAAAFHVIGRVSRWRPQWLIVPAACGSVWVLAIGPATAVEGFRAVPLAVTAVLAGAVTNPAALAQLARVCGGPGHWLPGQLPLALVAAALLAAVAWWAGWLQTDEWNRPVPRPGLASRCMGWLAAAGVRSGRILTRDGTRLGVDQATGRPVAVSWREAERGVLVTGSPWPGVLSSSFQFLHAAIRRRKPVIAVDLAGSSWLADAVAAACSAAGAPLQVFGEAGTGCYEPWRGGDPARKARLVMGVIDWDQAPDAARLGCQAWLTDVFAVAAAAPGEPGAAVLDEVAGLLRPGALRARLECVPPYHPRRRLLAERVRLAASRLEADQATASFVAGYLATLRASPLGRWLCSGQDPADPPGQRAGGGRIRLSEVVRQRGVALFSLNRDAHGRTAGMIANLVAVDVAALCTAQARTGMTGDGLVWVARCEAVSPPALTTLVNSGTAAGFSTVMTTTVPPAVAALAGQAGVLLVHRLDDPALAGDVAWLTGISPRPGAPAPAGARPADARGQSTAGLAAEAGLAPCPAVPGEALRALPDGEFTMVVRGQAGPHGTAGRLVPRGRAVPGRIPRHPPAGPTGAWPLPPPAPSPAAGAPSVPLGRPFPPHRGWPR